jgi:hypothetical protein
MLVESRSCSLCFGDIPIVLFSVRASIPCFLFIGNDDSYGKGTEVLVPVSLCATLFASFCLLTHGLFFVELLLAVLF